MILLANILIQAKQRSYLCHIIEAFDIAQGVQQRFARGVWDGDDLPSIDLGGATSAPAVTLSLEPMELGLCETAPFVGEPSWIERVLTLREEFGPFRLAYLEAILRAADEGASEAASTRGATNA